MKQRMSRVTWVFNSFAWALLGGSLVLGAPAQTPDPQVQSLRAEVAAKGWLLFSAKAPGGDFDLFLSRPNGSHQRNLTRTAEWSEYGGRFSPDGKRMLYRRQPKRAEPGAGESINHDLWGAMGTLVIANADGTNPRVLGSSNEWPWASWSPDGKQLACLYKREGKIRIVEAETQKIVREMPRQGIFQQLFWSGDGKRLVGTANLNGQDWNILVIDLASEQSLQVSRNLCCTPDWFQGDAGKVIYSSRTPGLGSEYGWTVLMQATADGKSRSLIYGERDRHAYFGCTSPDDKYVVFAVHESDGAVDGSLRLMRLADAPIVVPADCAALKEVYPGAKSGPVLLLEQSGFEPHWTYAEIP